MDPTSVSELPNDIDKKPEQQSVLPRRVQLARKVQSAKRSEYNRCWHFVSGSTDYFSEILSIFGVSRGSGSPNQHPHAKNDKEVSNLCSIVDQRDTVVRVEKGCVPYLTSKPIPEGYRLREVEICIDSEDQGYSSDARDDETGWTSFELSLGSPKYSTEVGNEGEGVSCEKWRGKVANNHDADDLFSPTKISDSELHEKAESGDVLTVWVRSGSAGRTITVKKVKIKAILEKIVESEVTRACHLAHLTPYPISGLPAGYQCIGSGKLVCVIVSSKADT